MFKKLLVILIFIFITPKLLLAGNVSKLFNEKSYDSAYRAGYADALAGDPESSFIIGKILVDGRGSAKENISKGIDFIKLSAKADYLKSVMFLAENYEDGKYTSENKSKALAYYEQCEKLRGSSKCSKKVTTLRIASSGEISKKSCVRYNKKNKKNFLKVGRCIARNYLEGNASSYFLKAFDNGNNSSFLLASQRMLKVKSNIDLMPLVIRIPDFKRKASKSEINKLKKSINQNGYDGSFCGKVTKKSRFSKPKVSSSNDAACALAAEAGDSEASTIAYEWWKNGTNGFPRKVKYADALLKKLENNENIDIAELLKKYENDPRLHFEKSMEFIKINKFNKSIVSKELKLELELIAQDKINDFAKDYRDIADVIEYIDWKFVDNTMLAKFYLLYMTQLMEEDELLSSPRVKKNIKKIPYTKLFIGSLGKLKGGGKLANEFMITAIFDNCNALNYAIKNKDELDIPIETIQEAQQLSINKCNLKVAKKSMKQLLKIAKRDLDSVKIFIEKRLNYRLPCKDYSEFLTFNRNDQSDFEVDYEYLNDFCSSFPVVAYKLATDAYTSELYDESYDYALKGCENEDHKSKGCDLLAMIIKEDKSTLTTDMSYDEKMILAIDYLKIGHEGGDINSSAFLHDITNKSVLFSIYSDSDLAKEIYPDLKKSKKLSAKLQVQKSCFSADPIKRIFKSCKTGCGWAKRINKRKDTDLVSRYLLKSIFKDAVCNQ